MHVQIAEEDSTSLAAYSRISIAFVVSEIMLPEPSATRAGSLLRFATEAIDAPFVKNYDAYPGNGPLEWSSRFDISHWGFLAAYVDDQRVGGAVVIARDPQIELLDGRGDLTLIWDLRVDPVYRGRGIGRALLSAIDTWARKNGTSVIKVETQNVNMPACRLYANQGFSLKSMNRSAYPDFPNETQLFWEKGLRPKE